MINENFDTRYVFPCKAENIQKAAAGFVKRNSQKAEVYDNAVILPTVQFNDYDVAYGRGGVCDCNGNYVESSVTKAKVIGDYSFEEYGVETCNEKVVFCGYFQKAWGHFLLEVVSRLWYALKNDTTVDSYVFIVGMNEERAFTGNYLEFLKLLGIADKVKIINKPTRFGTVIVPENGFVYNEYYTEGYVKMYDAVIKRALKQYSGKKYDRVFFSKRHMPISIESNLNEKFLDRFFEKNGFTVMYPETLSLTDTIGILQNAEYFAGIASSLLHNQIFAHKNLTTICIEKQAFYNPYQVMTAKIVNAKTVFIDACVSIFTVDSAGPFIYDYTKHLDAFVKDQNWVAGKPMSDFKFKRVFKKYLAFYFDFNSVYPPDWMFRQLVVNSSREMYNDVLRSKKVFKMPLRRRIINKIKRFYLKKRYH